MLAAAPELVNLTCPLCRAPRQTSRLGLAEVYLSEGDFVLEGMLRCGASGCPGRFPVLQGVPIVLKDFRSWWQSSTAPRSGPLCSSPQMSSYLGRVVADSYPQQALLSTYMTHHYGSNDDAYWQAVTRAIPEQDCGRALELGCSVGGFVFAAARRAKVSVGIDLDFNLVAAAAGIQRSGEVQYRRLRRARAFEDVHFDFEVPGNVVFLVADALDPPLLAEDWDLVAALNLLDNVALPTVLLGQMNALLRSGRRLVLGSPYQWRPDITDPGEWLETDAMDSASMVRAILFEQLIPPMQLHYQPVFDEPDLDWTLIQHDRQRRSYRVDLIVARKD
ncbi:MAG: class I SAM-dependent methyltransferase [Xanthomonadales bacterium]|nr:class I SAM-dependent methyltransferase [Xanthomonadales bacterium]